MTTPITILTDEEISRCVPAEEKNGFGGLQTDQGPLPLKTMDVQVTLEDLLAQVELSQTFVNTFDVPLEAVYIFPLPDRAAVTRFRLDVADRVIEGELQERRSARMTYQEAMVAGHRAALAEEERPNVFTLHVGNIPPGESARIRLSLSGPLEYDAGEVTFRFPLVVAPRFIPGNPLDGGSVGDGAAVDTDAVPDASRITPPILLPGYPNPVQLSFRVDVQPTSFLPKDFRCSLHSVFMQRDDLGGYRFQLQPNERLNRDFVLRYQISEETVQTSLNLVPDKDGNEGTFILTVVPPDSPQKNQRPRDVVFVLDRSGSMSGWKMVAARRALAYMVDSLTEQDRFSVFAFDNELETLPFARHGNLIPASHRNRYRATEYLHTIFARGGTQMARPLELAVQQLQGDRDRVLVLITDGQVGNEDQILNVLSQHLQGIRIFTLGIDQAVNEGFLKRLAALGGGSCDVVESENRLDEVMYKVHRRISNPVLSNLELQMSGLELDHQSLVPNCKLDLFSGTPLTLMGRYSNSTEGSVVVSATDETGRPWSQKIVARTSYHPAAAVVWARSRIRHLEDRFVARTANLHELEQQILALSLRFRVLCRFTAFVAVDKSETVNEGGQQHRVVQAVEQPAGWGMLGQPPQPKASSIAHKLDRVRRPRCQMGYDVSGATLMPTESTPPPPAAEAAPPPVADSLCMAEAPESKRGGARRGKDRKRKTEQKSKGLWKNLSEFKKGCRGLDDDLDVQETISAGRKPTGIFGALFSWFTGKEEKKKASDDLKSVPPGIASLSAYQNRAKELRELLKTSGKEPLVDRIQILGRISVKLSELLEDMRSIGLIESALEPLQKLHTELETLTKSDQPQPPEVDRVWQLAEKTLGEFVKAG